LNDSYSETFNFAGVQKTLDFNPCMKHKAVRKTVRKFAETELGPISHEIDRESRFPWEVIEKMRSLNYFGLQVPQKYGGADLDTISYAITIEEISRVCAGIGLCITVHNSVAAYPIVRFGSEDQKKRFLPFLASGEHIGAFCLTEANAGSDAGAVETTAVFDNGDYIINGTKHWITGGTISVSNLVFARFFENDRELGIGGLPDIGRFRKFEKNSTTAIRLSCPTMPSRDISTVIRRWLPLDSKTRGCWLKRIRTWRRSFFPSMVCSRKKGTRRCTWFAS